MDLTPEQRQQLQSLGLSPTPALTNQSIAKTKFNFKLTSPLIPLVSISGFTLLSFGGLILLKSKTSTPPALSREGAGERVSSSEIQSISPTQVPKSIQHYLLTSQQYFSQALELQQSAGQNDQIIALLNQSILTATDAIKSFPADYRGYEQRAHIYQSLTSSRAELIASAIADYERALNLNSTSADISRNIAALYAQKGDVTNTLAYLAQTTALDPTKAQNFYDLARIQQQAGLIADAVSTYNQLLPLISDPTQKTTLTSQVDDLKKLLAQTNSSSTTLTQAVTSSPTPGLIDGQSLLQASIDPVTIDSPSSSSGLIIAAAQADSALNVTGQTDSNALSGTATLPATQASLTITNQNVTSATQIYVTATSGGKNQTLKILSKTEGSFVVGYDTSLSESVDFKWWIVK